MLRMVPSRVARTLAFPTTRWSVVLAAGRQSTAASHEALTNLCEHYWRPLYVYARRQGFGAEDAQDLVQGFITRLLETGAVARADPGRGRFRAFLLTSFRNFLADQRDRGRARKRGGGDPGLSLALQTAERWNSLEPLDYATPERIYDRRWALTVLNRVMDRLRAEFVRAGKLSLFDNLKPCLLGESGERRYAEIAARLGTSDGAIRVAVHRLRKRYRDLMREEIAHTVAGEDDISSEIGYLLNALSK